MSAWIPGGCPLAYVRLDSHRCPLCSHVRFSSYHRQVLHRPYTRYRPYRPHRPDKPYRRHKPYRPYKPPILPIRPNPYRLRRRYNPTPTRSYRVRGGYRATYPASPGHPARGGAPTPPAGGSGPAERPTRPTLPPEAGQRASGAGNPSPGHPARGGERAGVPVNPPPRPSRRRGGGTRPPSRQRRGAGAGVCKPGPRPSGARVGGTPAGRECEPATHWANAHPSPSRERAARSVNPPPARQGAEVERGSIKAREVGPHTGHRVYGERIGGS